MLARRNSRTRKDFLIIENALFEIACWWSAGCAQAQATGEGHHQRRPQSKKSLSRGMTETLLGG
jgi:hypothetical protein